MRESISDKFIISRMYILIIIFFSVFLSSSCNSQNHNNSTGPYDTMLDAVNGVLESEDKNLLFASGAYLYENQENYDKEQPAYSLVFNDKELDGNEITSYHYIVGDDIELTAEFKTPPVSEETLEIIVDTNLQDQLKIIEGYEDLTHKVVELSKDKGRELDKEVFSAGYALSGHYEESVFYIYIIGGEEYLQAAYNTKTEELIVAESIDSSIDSDISNWN